MRTIEWTSRFKRDYKRVSKGRFSHVLEDLLSPVIQALADDRELEPRYRDHALSGNLVGIRECHIKPDLLLMYYKPDDLTLILVRIGSHAELEL